MQTYSDPAFNSMLVSAQSRLYNRSPKEIAQKAGTSFLVDSSVMEIRSFNDVYQISCHDFTVQNDIEKWLCLILLHYLDIADGAPVSPELCTFGELKGGLIRGGNFDRSSARELSAFLNGKSPESIKAVCAALGAEFLPSNADLCASLPFLPRCPAALKVWFADEEFPASGSLLLHKSAEHYLSVEDAVMAGELILRRLSETYSLLF